MKFFAVIIFFVLTVMPDSGIKAQDTLPAFSVINRNGKIILSWVNQFPVVKQMSIQRSFDSARGFKTILTLPDPTSVTNGFLDNNAPDTVLFYKLYILLDSGKYIFSKAKRPEIKTMQTVVKAAPPPAKAAEAAGRGNTKPVSNPPISQTVSQPATAAVTVSPKTATASKPTDKGPVTSKDAATEAPVAVAEKTVNTPPPEVEESLGKKYAVESTKTSIKKRSDGLKADTVSVTKAEVEVYKPSSFIFTNNDGNVTMVLPSGKTQEYSIKFFEERGDLVFQMGSVKEHIVILDKSNFLHSGWFRFELYQNGVLKEKNKIQIPRDPGIR